ncbi:Rieske (2Fe-2S) protein [Pseudonocardia sp. CA-107938]|uniref:Rieske (2Fe-2S) protein n=1 Tax=Pseudonocardia sp. CA-107938 TaxID=3240021 RepID=UPI003D8EA971
MTTPVSRRAAVVGVTAAIGCAACATYGQRPGDAAPAPAAAPGGAAPSAAAGASAPALAAKADVPVGGGIVLADQQIVLTQPTAGQFKGFSAICTHQGCTVNAVADGVIKCPCHGSSFAIADGSVVTGPARKPLPPRAVTVQGDSLTSG